jgi:steroid delta-isomerase-like uncharacterized protein
MSESNIELMRQMAKFETAHDEERLFALYTDEVVFRDVALGVLATGKPDVRRLLKSVYDAMEGYSMTLTSAYADENGGGAEWLMAGKHTGDFMDFPATGVAWELRAASIMRFSNGLVSHRSDYWSVSAFTDQVGLE